MYNSIITQKKIAKVFKQEVIKVGLEAVSVSELMKKVGMRRQTFYDYFLDKYDLIEWIFRQEATEIIEDYMDYSSWDQIINNLIDYFEQNNLFYHNVLSYSGQSAFNKYFKYQIVNLLNKIYSYQNQDNHIDEHYPSTYHSIDPLIKIYTNAIVESTSEWIMDGCPVPAHEFAEYLTIFIKQVLIPCK